MKKCYSDIEALVKAENPQVPVYCIYPHVYRRSTEHFINGFPGRVLYAIKANNHPDIVRILYESGIRHFDCASLPEIQLVHEHCPGSTSYFMNPVRLSGHARTAQQDYGVRHFVIDHHTGLAPLIEEIDPSQAVIFARMAVSHKSASEDLSRKFGARPENIPALLTAISDSGAEPALAFNVGSGVTDPEAYAYAMGVARDVLDRLPFKVRLLDIGGGFPKSYPGFKVPDLDEYFKRTGRAREDLPLADNGEVLSEPGRALSAPGMSAVTRVLLRKTDRIYLNDGMYGVFWELRFRAHLQFPFRVYQNGAPLAGETKSFRLFGPTCDSTDQLPAELMLPADIAVGDHIEFGTIGAYSLSGRSRFNGFFSEHVISFTDDDAQPPSIHDQL